MFTVWSQYGAHTDHEGLAEGLGMRLVCCCSVNGYRNNSILANSSENWYAILVSIFLLHVN